MNENRSSEIVRLNILLAGVALCFRPDEPRLHSSQFYVRNLAPTESYTESCLVELIHNERVEVVPRSTKTVTGDVYIRCPTRTFAELDDFFVEVTNAVISLIESDEEAKIGLERLTLDVYEAECLQYCMYYAKSSGLRVTHKCPATGKLKVMLRDISLGQVRALLWRAIKNAVEKSTEAEFEHLVGMAFDFYITYLAANLSVSDYRRPKPLRMSKISQLICLFGKS